MASTYNLKKARRQFYKATKNRPQDYDADWSAFRAVEKRYKARFPPPDLSTALDLATLHREREQEIDRGSPGAVEFNEIHLKDPGGKKAYATPRIPGAVVKCRCVCLLLIDISRSCCASFICKPRPSARTYLLGSL